MNLSKISIGVIGMGYVGLPLAMEFAKKIKVVGFDINSNRINQLRNNIDVTNEILKSEFNDSRKIIFSDNLESIKSCDVFIVTVPTPVSLNKKPDLKPLIQATKMISKVVKKNNIIIYESTVFPGVTEEICGPILEKYSGLKINKNLFLGYSPERINPGDKTKKVTDITKITSGSDLKTTKIISRLYSLIIKAGIHQTDSIKIAEAAKVIENTQRDLNIAFINELSLIFKKMNISTEKVLKAAETKWNFISFRPGLVGGHCIGVDPYYLTHKSKKIGYNPKLILAGRSLNDSMPSLISKDIERLIKIKKIKNPKVLIMGLTFKENCPDTRNSKVLNLYNLLNKKMLVNSFDPHFKLWSREFIKKYNVIGKIDNKKFDIVILAVKHKQFIKQKNKLTKYCKKRGFVYDLKYIIPENKDHYRL
ncbi:nucleotide sugar dehydrogenase [Candidatus Pelagibacter sp.]|nr:nucleotide sugar dehydrogenase [Candidatus Pelagibacter sp.]